MNYIFKTCVMLVQAIYASHVSDVPEYEIIFYTAAFGRQYTTLASSWCAGVDRRLVKRLQDHNSIETTSLVITDQHHIRGCSRLFRQSNVHTKRSVSSKHQIQIKLLKMTVLPYMSKLYMWIDVDVRPTEVGSKWFCDYLESLVHDNKTTHEHLDPINGIALTPTQRVKKKRYNGGVFVYSGRECIDAWKDHLVRSREFRDQPSLKLVVESPKCTLIMLPKYTQTFMKFKTYFDEDVNRVYAFVHLTGLSKKAHFLVHK